jgi:NAD(P)-dependent dehydrogenase (short-subunit alcohol dehydrogenase family)
LSKESGEYGIHVNAVSPEVVVVVGTAMALEFDQLEGWAGALKPLRG